MKQTQNPSKFYLKDYKPTPFEVLNTELYFNIFSDHTILTCKTNYKSKTNQLLPLALHGEDLELVEVKLNQKCLSPSEYNCDDKFLTLTPTETEFTLTITTKLYPEKNTQLEGLYKSGTGLCTQCEAQAFRRMTYFYDRPDIMTKYQVTIEADKTQFPILLSNGNLISQKDLSNHRHQVLWQDPFKKPSYLFALVAGDYGCLQDEFTTMSGRKILLEIYCVKGLEARCQYAMEALKNSMKWDEKVFGLEYDLDRYMILAVDDFNMGAMENKGLNIFNSRLVFANQESATDKDYFNIEAVIGHEYFHNWSGNRITLRDWFQLSLKEGLTVYREQEFSADQSSRSIKRIDDVQFLRNKQFSEDAGANAHPVRPESAYAIDNFYTLTIYEKGAELIRVLKVLLGEVTFNKGLTEYFKMYDGQAVTIDDFIKTFELTAKTDLTQFKNWYSQAGTPKVKVVSHYDEKLKTFKITLSQSCPQTPEQKESGLLEKAPFVIPIKMGLLSQSGQPFELLLNDKTLGTENVLVLKEKEQTWTFTNIDSRPIPSLLRGFSAPIELDYQPSTEDLILQMNVDTDGFNRWESTMKLSENEILKSYNASVLGEKYEFSPVVLKSFQSVLDRAHEDESLCARLLKGPGIDYLKQKITDLHPDHLFNAEQAWLNSITLKFQNQFMLLYKDLFEKTSPSEISAKAQGRRSLLNQLLSMFQVLEDGATLALKQFEAARNMTEQYGALAALNNQSTHERELALMKFYSRWRSEPVVMNKWLALEAAHSQPDCIHRMLTISQSSDFKITNPNNVYSLWVTFSGANMLSFHRSDGLSYQLFTDELIKIDKVNRQAAARVVSAFDDWKTLEPQRRKLMKAQIERLAATPGLSTNCLEKVKNMLT